MKTSFHFPNEQPVQAYNRLLRLMQNNSQIIFDSMQEITQNRSNPFSPPNHPDEFDQKHEEIRRLLSFGSILSGLNVVMELMEAIGRRVQTRQDLIGLTEDQVFEELFLETSTSVLVKLNRAFRWSAVWEVTSPIQGEDDRIKVAVEFYNSEWGEIVPKYVVDYINAAILSYENSVHGPAAALLSIAIEATLRDVLRTRGYAFQPGATRVDVYSYCNAEVRAEGNAYKVYFPEPMPRSPAEFHIPEDRDSLNIQVRRKIHRGRTDLLMIVPESLIHHWSSDEIKRPAERCVNGLREALDIARNEERFLTARDLPEDFDEVILKVRNNLIHLSGQALETSLNAIDPSGETTLGDFLNDTKMIYDLIVNVPYFINRKYVELREDGHLSP
jgi:hypothetical protein